MAGFSSNKPSAPITGINVTPLVDITLVLLIIFMVTAKLVVSRAVPMDLPKAATGGVVQEIFSVSLPADQTLILDGKPLTETELLTRARTAVARNPELRAIIDADGSVPHKRVLAALDILRQAGLNRVAFGASPTAPLVPSEPGSSSSRADPRASTSSSRADPRASTP